MKVILMHTIQKYKLFGYRWFHIDGFLTRLSIHKDALQAYCYPRSALLSELKLLVMAILIGRIVSAYMPHIGLIGLLLES